MLLEPPNGYFGVLGERTKETDFQLAGIPNLPPARNTFATTNNQYNQNEVSPVSCTLHGALGAVSDLTSYKFTLDERKSLWNQAITLGASPTGWYIDAAVDLVRKFWNQKNPDDQLASFVVGLLDPDFDQIIKQGYSVVIGYSGNGLYNMDHYGDNILNNTLFGVSTYGHCVRICYKDENTYNIIVDNYAGGSNNVYEVPKANLAALVNNKVFFQSGYVFVSNQDLNALNMPQTISPWAQKSVEKARAKGLVIPAPQSQMSAADIELALVKLGVLSQTIGNITEERMAVIADRVHLLG